MDERLHRIRNAYDLTVEQYDHDIDPLGQVPLELRESAAEQRISGTGSWNVFSRRW
jgi:hypothetical protein